MFKSRNRKFKLSFFWSFGMFFGSDISIKRALLSTRCFALLSYHNYWILFSPIIMEVENGYIWKVTILLDIHPFLTSMIMGGSAFLSKLGKIMRYFFGDPIMPTHCLPIASLKGSWLICTLFSGGMSLALEAPASIWKKKWWTTIFPGRWCFFLQRVHFPLLSSWWFQTVWKISIKMDHFPK